MQEAPRKVWILHKEDYHLCKVKNTDGYQYEIELPDGTITKTTEVFRANPPKFDLVDDLASLSHLNQPSVLDVLKNRYNNNFIYTHSGLFLVTINPYKELDIYSPKFMHLYTQNDNSLPPHIYKTVNEAYTNMLMNKTDQSILITGESGAGKTENTKKAISFLLTLSDTKKSKLVDQIINANVILEAFGNAMTIRNDNSSRFGKFIQLNFSSGNIVGCSIQKYLLEKSRVVQTTKEERNYHIFYQLLRSDRKEILDKFHLSSDLKKYKILNNYTNLNDKEMFNELINAFNILKIPEEEVMSYFRIISVILHLGNIEFHQSNANSSADDKTSSSVKIKNIDSLNLVCNLLNIPVHKFIKYILNPNKSAGKEEITVNHSIKQCCMILEGVIKILYDWLFDSIINSINKILNSNNNFNNYIGILDIAGFEIFPFNSLEQLCINYTNEKLQQFFNHHMFILEQEIYKQEEIKWDYIDFGLDLKPTIDTIDKVFSILDDQCLLLGGSDKSFLLSLKNQISQSNNIFNKTIFFNKIEDDCFKLLHYAGKVEYITNDWLVKNYDPYFTDIINLLSLDISNDLSSKGFFRTVAQFYKTQLELLMSKLRNTNPFFVRCIIPNNTRKRNSIDNLLVLKQLKCNGVLEGIRISRLGYPNRMKYIEFNKRYQIILYEVKGSNVHLSTDDLLTKNILNKLNIANDSYKFGRTMVFFKQDVLAYIEEMRETKVNKVFNEITNHIKNITSLLKQNKNSSRNNSIKVIQSNGNASNEFRRWKWWYFYLKIKPLLKVHQIDDIIKGKESEITYLNDLLIKKEKENNSLINENNEIKNELLKKETLNETINQLIKEKEKEILLKNEILMKEEENKKIIDELNNEILKNKEFNKSTTGNIKELKEINEALNQKIKEKEELIHENKKLIIRLNTESETNKKSNANKTEEIIKIKDKEISQLKYELEIIKENNNELLKIKEINNNSLIKIKELINELNKTKEEIKNNLEILNNKSALISKLEEENKRILVLENKLRNQTMDNELLNKEVERNNSKITELEEKIISLEEVEKNNKSMKNDIYNLTEENNKLINQNYELEENIKRIEKSNFKELEIRINELNKKIIKEKKINKELEAANAFLIEENKRLNSNKIKEIEELKNNYERKIKELDLKLLSYNLNLREESESADDSRITVALEEEKSRCNELERLLTEQENKNMELQSKLKNKEYEFIDKVNSLEKKLNVNKEKYNTLINGINNYYNKLTNHISVKEDHSNCTKRLNLLKEDYENEKEYLINKLNNNKKETKKLEEENINLYSEIKEKENTIKENAYSLKIKDNELLRLSNELNLLLSEQESLNIRINKLTNELKEGELEEKNYQLEIRNNQLNRKVTELEKMVEFYKPFSGIKK